jgi:hypothetical protein
MCGITVGGGWAVAGYGIGDPLPYIGNRFVTPVTGAGSRYIILTPREIPRPTASIASSIRPTRTGSGTIGARGGEIERIPDSLLPMLHLHNKKKSIWISF